MLRQFFGQLSVRGVRTVRPVRLVQTTLIFSLPMCFEREGDLVAGRPRLASQ
jgi:hypothetical protein